MTRREYRKEMEIIQARNTNRRIATFNDALAEVYKDADEKLKKSHDLKNVDTYVAACTKYIQTSRDRRAAMNMLQHIGRVLGHDRNTLTIDDRRSYQEIIATLAQEFPEQEKVIDAQVAVKEPAKNGQAAT